MKAHLSIPAQSSLARPLAPEEVRRGQYVTPLDEIHEWPSFLWPCPDSNLEPQDLVRVRLKSDEGGIPLRVTAVCLPFVSVRTPQQTTRVLDLRRVQLVRLSREFGKLVTKALAKHSS